MDFNLSTDNYHDEVKKYEHEIISCSLQSFANDLASEQTYMIHMSLNYFIADWSYYGLYFKDDRT